MQVRVAVECGAILGESPVWCDDIGRLAWVDIEGAALWIFDPQGGQAGRVALPDRPAAVVPGQAPGGLVLAMADGSILRHNPGRDMSIVAEVPLEEGVRLNDGRCDPMGRLVVGGHVEEGPGTAGLHLVHPDGRVETLASGLRTANAIAFLDGGRVMTLTDSPTRQLAWHTFAAPLPPAFRHVTLEGEGVFDGAAVDDEGGLWVANWDGAAILRYAPDGRLADRIALSVTRPTSLAFGGPSLEILFVTSASQGCSEPEAGHLLAIEGLGVRGRREARFGDPS